VETIEPDPVKVLVSGEDDLKRLFDPLTGPGWRLKKAGQPAGFISEQPA